MMGAVDVSIEGDQVGGVPLPCSRILLVCILIISSGPLVSGAIAGPTQDARRTTLVVPPGGVIIAHVVDGAWTVEVQSAGGATSMLGGGGSPARVAECVNDEPATPGQGPTASVFPTRFYLSPNDAWPLAENRASQDLCTGATVFEGPVSYFRFETAGDYGGRARLDGWAGWFSGWFEVSCEPAGTLASAGVGPVWPFAGMLRNSYCTIESQGSVPPEWLEWHGFVENRNTFPGTETRAIAM